jgi:hypothetical protein
VVWLSSVALRTERTEFSNTTTPILHHSSIMAIPYHYILTATWWRCVFGIRHDMAQLSTALPSSVLAPRPRHAVLA